MSNRNRGNKAKLRLGTLINRFVHNDDQPAILTELNGSSDRGAALIGAAIVDSALAEALTKKLCFADEAHHSRIFYTDNGALSSFSSRISMARCMAIISERIEKYCTSIRNIRNAFAHSPISIDFNNELIAANCENFPHLENGYKEFEVMGLTNENRIRYTVACVRITVALNNFVTTTPSESVKIHVL